MGDKRFAHPAWARNPIYRRLVQVYLVDATAVMRLVDEVDLDPKSRERARFALTLLVDALAPTNTLAGNPSLPKAVERAAAASPERRLALALVSTDVGDADKSPDHKPITVLDSFLEAVYSGWGCDIPRERGLRC